MKWGLLFTLIIIISACSDERGNIGADLINQEEISLITVDTATVEMAQTRIDSLLTGSSGRLLVGSFYQEQTGTINSTIFLQPGITDSDQIEGTRQFYKYAAVVLFTDNYSYGDTTSSMTLELFRTKEHSIDELVGFYNTTVLPETDNKLGEVSFIPQINRIDSLELPVPFDFGSELFDRLVNDPESIDTNKELWNLLPGMILSCKSGNSLIGFKSSAQLRLYYEDRTKIPSVTRYLSFSIGNTAETKVGSSTRLIPNVTQLNTVTGLKKSYSGKYTNDVTFIQGGTGFLSRISFPYIRDLNVLENHYLLKAVLQLEVDPDQEAPESGVAIYPTDKNGVSTGDYVTCYLTADNSLGRNPYYEVEVTGFINKMLLADPGTRSYLQLILPGTTMNKTFETVLIRNNSKKRTKLKLYYGTIDD